MESRRDNSLVGTIDGAINGGQYEGRAVRIPARTILNFRVQKPLFVDVVDRGVDRNGNHYHDWDRRDDYYRYDRRKKPPSAHEHGWYATCCGSRRSITIWQTLSNSNRSTHVS